MPAVTRPEFQAFRRGRALVIKGKIPTTPAACKAWLQREVRHLPGEITFSLSFARVVPASKVETVTVEDYETVMQYPPPGLKRIRILMPEGGDYVIESGAPVPGSRPPSRPTAQDDPNNVPDRTTRDE